MNLTDDEKKAVAALKRLAKRWPDTLWLFCGGQHGVAIMKTDEDGLRVTTGSGEGFDHEYCVGTVDIPSDGGDW